MSLWRAHLARIRPHHADADSAVSADRVGQAPATGAIGTFGTNGIEVKSAPEAADRGRDAPRCLAGDGEGQTSSSQPDPVAARAAFYLAAVNEALEALAAPDADLTAERAAIAEMRA